MLKRSCYFKPHYELDKFRRLPQEDMDSCDPLKWWYSRRLQFPNLCRLALLGIPGSAVAVECIFSAARDTLSLRRASLNPIPFKS
ncbi:hypothetical protein PTI98_007511 [Pleurotus ostreatus]|nr:hypothetical protein PTI98_007511 [Pleurotus ostreatus]